MYSVLLDIISLSFRKMLYATYRKALYISFDDSMVILQTAAPESIGRTEGRTFRRWVLGTSH